MGQGLLRDRLLIRLDEMGDAPDYVRLAEEILTIRNVPEPLARRLVAQALVQEDRREAWTRVGEEACGRAPGTPGVYMFRDAGDAVLYVGKALNLRRRLRAHFAPGRWRVLKPVMARVVKIEWEEVGSDLEALLLESQRIHEFRPTANVQRERGAPSFDRARDIVVLLPAVDAVDVRVVAVRRNGEVLSQLTGRDGRDVADLADALVTFFAGRTATASVEQESGASHLAAIVFAWLRYRGSHATRFEASEAVDAGDWQRKLSVALASPTLFHERLIVR